MHKVLRLPAAASAVGKSRAWVYSEIAGGRFPKPIKIGSSTVFLESEIETYLTERIAERDAAANPAPRKPAAPRRGKAA